MSELVLKNTIATLEEVFSAGDSDSNNVTVTITRADGSTVVSSGATTHAGVGDYTYTLAPQAELDIYKVKWSGTWGGVAMSVESYAEIVGGQLFTLAELRAFGDRALADTSKYPDQVLRAQRQRTTDLFYNCMGNMLAFFPRFARDVLDGNNKTDIFLQNHRPRRIISCSVGGVALDSTAISQIKLYPTGRLYRPQGWIYDRENIVVQYEHGWPATPEDVKRAAMVHARYELVSSDISDRMISFSNDLGDFRLSVPGYHYPTGIPIVDSTLARYDETEPLLRSGG